MPTSQNNEYTYEQLMKNLQMVCIYNIVIRIFQSNQINGKCLVLLQSLVQFVLGWKDSIEVGNYLKLRTWDLKII